VVVVRMPALAAVSEVRVSARRSATLVSLADTGILRQTCEGQNKSGTFTANLEVPLAAADLQFDERGV
jgi:hypothetical protein